MSRSPTGTEPVRTPAAVDLAVADGTRGRIELAGAISAPAVHGRPVVVAVDGDPHVRTVLQVCLETAGCTVVLARDAAEALRRVDRLRPDAVVTGVDLPGLDGWQLVRRLRGDLHMARVPIVVFAERAHHDTRGDNLTDVHAVDRLVGAQAVADLITLHLHRMSAHRPPGRAACDDGVPHRRVEKSWVPHFG